MVKEPVNIVGSKIKQLREENDWTQIVLSKKTGINNSVLSRIESGNRSLDHDLLLIFANIFDVSTDYLLGCSDYRNHVPTQAAHAEGAITEEVLYQLEEILRKTREEYKKEKGK
jgi:transcriptional regulator with XRE-family HTH domain